VISVWNSTVVQPYSIDSEFRFVQYMRVTGARYM